ncbi:hypothetical protein [Faecalicatena contorta]|nr:hypothetical protein [Faecalicatena contorta]
MEIDHCEFPGEGHICFCSNMMTQSVPIDAHIEFKVSDDRFYDGLVLRK